jgi:hypothetical protein
MQGKFGLRREVGSKRFRRHSSTLYICTALGFLVTPLHLFRACSFRDLVFRKKQFLLVQFLSTQESTPETALLITSADGDDEGDADAILVDPAHCKEAAQRDA